VPANWVLAKAAMKPWPQAALKLVVGKSTEAASAQVVPYMASKSIVIVGSRSTGPHIKSPKSIWGLGADRGLS
jgi:hypothetical protein